MNAVDQITAVLLAHRWLEVEWACRCRNRHLRLADHPAHVAERIAAELGLTDDTQPTEPQVLASLVIPWPTNG